MDRWSTRVCRALAGALFLAACGEPALEATPPSSTVVTSAGIPAASTTATTAATTTTTTAATVPSSAATSTVTATTAVVPSSTAPSTTTTTTIPPTTAVATTLPYGDPSPTCVNGWITPEPWSDLSRTPYHELRAFYGLADDDIFVTEEMRYFVATNTLDGVYEYQYEFWYVVGHLQRDPSFRGRWLAHGFPPNHPYGRQIWVYLFAPYDPPEGHPGASWISFLGCGAEAPGTTPVEGLPGTYPNDNWYYWRAHPESWDFGPNGIVAGCLPEEWRPPLDER